MRDFPTSPAPSYSGCLARRYLRCSESSFIHSPGQEPRAQALFPSHTTSGPSVDSVNSPSLARLRVIHPPTTMENDNRKTAANRLFFSSSNQMNGPGGTKIRYALIMTANPNNNPAAPANIIESRREEATTRISPHTKISAAELSPISSPANLLVIRNDSQPRALNKAIEVSFVSARQSQKTPREVRPVSIARMALARPRSSPVIP